MVCSYIWKKAFPSLGMAGVDIMKCSGFVYSDEYSDYIIPYFGLLEPLTIPENACFQDVGGGFGVMFQPGRFSLEAYGYQSIPKCYGLLDTSNLEATGVGQVRRQPYLGYRGNGVLIGILDTGIDYTHPAFINGDGTTRIAAIWDQTQPQFEDNDEEDMQKDNGETAYFYGTEYTREQINEALRNSNPSEIVPESDENGHGTAMAGIIAGNEDRASAFSGVAPLATLLVVKLKQAKQGLRDYFQIPDSVQCFSETDLLFGVYYLFRKAKQFGMPLVIYFGVGTNQGSHTGENMLCQFLNAYAELQKVNFVAAAGNETNRGHHFFSSFNSEMSYIDAELRVAEGEKGFSMEIWADSVDFFSVAVISPAGEFTGKIPIQWLEGAVSRLLLEKVTIYTTYHIASQYSLRKLILMRFFNVVPGTWKIRVYSGSGMQGNFHIWLPMENFIKEDTRFLSPSPDVVVCDPGNGRVLFTISAYDHRTGGMYLYSSRGYSADGRIKPELAAPGVEITAPNLYGGYGAVTGTSAAAAQAAGMCALLWEWGVVEGFAPELRGGDLQNLMIMGAQRSGAIYPNPENGYGFANIYSTFDVLRMPFV